MTQHIEHSEDFTKAHVESWLRILGIFISSEHECLAALLVSELIDEYKKSKKRRGKTISFSVSSSVHFLVFPLLEFCHLNFPVELPTPATPSCQERCCANALDFVEPHMDDHETKEMLSRVERKFDQFQI